MSPPCHSGTTGSYNLQVMSTSSPTGHKLNPNSSLNHAPRLNRRSLTSFELVIETASEELRACPDQITQL